jgi:hypothetical protein
VLEGIDAVMARHGVWHWDVIVVDGPTGYAPETPGRMQAIATAAALASEATTVFIHDSNRDAESRCARPPPPPI